MTTSTRSVEYRVKTCPICRGSHQLSLTLAVTRTEKPPVYFGGETNSETGWDVTVVCPIRKISFVEHARLKIEPGESLEGVEPAQASQASRPRELRDWLTEGLAEEIKISQATARDFCKTMISVCAGSIPVFFAVLNYLGHERVVSRGWGLSVAPPVLLLAATTVFALASRPVMIDLKDVNKYSQAREKRLRGVNRFMEAATVLFLSGVGAAIIVWSIALMR